MTNNPSSIAEAFLACDYERVLEMVAAGADPNFVDQDGYTPLLCAIFGVDTATVRLLLERGADPNLGCGDEWETILDAALFDYAYEAWIRPMKRELDSDDDAHYATPDARIALYQREAEAPGYLLPEIPRLLRQHGALSGAEMARRLGGDGTERICWRDGQWHLDAPPAPSL